MPPETPKLTKAVTPQAQRTHDVGLAEQFAADIFAECSEIAAKMKFASGPGPTFFEIGMAHYESGELVTETLIVPIHLVVE